MGGLSKLIYKDKDTEECVDIIQYTFNILDLTKFINYYFDTYPEDMLTDPAIVDRFIKFISNTANIEINSLNFNSYVNFADYIAVYNYDSEDKSKIYAKVFSEKEFEKKFISIESELF